jgi:septum formation protein
MRVAEEKARTVAAQASGRPVLAADTVVVIDGQILGKPVDTEDARRMLRLLSGRTHEVLTAVVLMAGNDEGSFLEGGIAKSHGTSYMHVDVTMVEFATISKAEIDWYVASGEPMDKAGAYAIQALASRFVTRIEGSHSNVVGLPVALVYAMCTQAGILLS